FTSRLQKSAKPLDCCCSRPPSALSPLRTALLHGPGREEVMSTRTEKTTLEVCLTRHAAVTRTAARKPSRENIQRFLTTPKSLLARSWPRIGHDLQITR